MPIATTSMPTGVDAPVAASPMGVSARRRGWLWARLPHHEFWPAWVFYAPMVPVVAWYAVRHGHPLAFLAANPGIEHGGGWVHESKFRIADDLIRTGAPQLATRLIAGGPAADRRTDAALAVVREDARFAFPVILKPDRGERGFGVRLARREEDVREYFRGAAGDTLVQAYHAGPHECGIMWVRDEAAGETGAGDARRGRILAVTAKAFPEVVGDGRRTLRELIMDHPRYRRQARVFVARHAARLERVVPEGERVRLAEAGNHCQGTLFADGSALVTPALEVAIGRIAAAFPGGLDFGRFDIRYASEESLRRGEGFAIVELNGTSAEATALYDPEKPARWAYALLRAQWRALFAAGAARMREGHRPPRLLDMIRLIRRHYRSRSGPAISD